LYLVVITTLLLGVETRAIASSEAPLALAVESGRFAALSPAVRIGACLGSLGVLLSLLAGVSRTTFAMAAGGDLPRFLSAVHIKNKVPHRAELAIGFLVALIVSLADMKT